jgi:MMP 1-O-methyltransferase
MPAELTSEVVRLNSARPSGASIDCPVTFDRTHPICRGDYVALVFSGSGVALAELAGEPTALTRYKFALPDPRLHIYDDFAASAGVGLPTWPADQVRPIDGLCYVFSDDRRPHVAELRSQGALDGEHWMVTDQVRRAGNLAARLSEFVNSIPPNAQILILGYGHQGRAIAQCLHLHCGVRRDRIVVHDGSGDSRTGALNDGLACCDDPGQFAGAAVIYSPLAHHERLARIMAALAEDGATAFDNSSLTRGLCQFNLHQGIWCDAAAKRMLQVEERRIRLKHHRFAVPCVIVRHEIRRFGRAAITHLQSGETHQLYDQGIDLSQPSLTCPYDSNSFVRSVGCFVALRPSASVGMFAARECAAGIWPDATFGVLPSQHEVELGATGFERLLRNHLDGREIVATMQTPAQRVILGICAHHYANRRPIIEIGSALGGSALLMAAATERSNLPIYSIDPDAATRGIMRFAFEREGHANRLVQIVRPSDEAVDELGHLRGESGLVFIDGLHTEAGCLTDFQHYSAMVAPGGALIFHDVVPQLQSVMRVVLGQVLQDRRFEPRCLVDGLMVFERRQN